MGKIKNNIRRNVLKNGGLDYEKFYSLNIPILTAATLLKFLRTRKEEIKGKTLKKMFFKYKSRMLTNFIF